MIGLSFKKRFKILFNDAQAFTLQVDRKWCQSNVTMVLFAIQRWENGMPSYKTHWNFIQSNTRMLMERALGLLEGKFEILLKIVDIPLHHSQTWWWFAYAYITCVLSIQMPLIWTKLWRHKKNHKQKQIQHLITSKELINSKWLKNKSNKWRGYKIEA